MFKRQIFNGPGQFKQLLALFTTCIVTSCHADLPQKPTVKVFKYAGARQCEFAGVPLDKMASELGDAGISVICSQSGHDGLVRIAVCGEESGNINIYTISREKLPAARALGYESITNLTEYQDQPCE